MAKDYYHSLGLNKNASKEEIKKVYKELAKKYHPDVSKEQNAEEKFKEVSEAYAILSDDTKRQQYDQFGSEGFHQKYSQEDIFRNFNFEDVFGDVFGDSPFEMFFGGGGRRRKNRGSDLRYDMKIEFEEAVFGCTKEIKVKKPEPCEECKGTGSKDGKLNACRECEGAGQVRASKRTPFGTFTQVTTCPECHGEGKIITNHCNNCKGQGRLIKEKTIKINIPPGVDQDSQLKVRGEGESGIRGTTAGDLYIVINVEESEIFERQGNDIILEIPLSFSQAALGDEIKIPTLEKEIKLKIPEGTQTGMKFRLKGEGIPYLDGYGKGDLYIIVSIITPKSLSKEQKKLLEQLKKTEDKKSLLDRIKEFAKRKL